MSWVQAAIPETATHATMLDEGRTYGEVEEILGCSSPYITRWKRRFLDGRIRGLESRYVGGQPRV